MSKWPQRVKLSKRDVAIEMLASEEVSAGNPIIAEGMPDYTWMILSLFGFPENTDGWCRDYLYHGMGALDYKVAAVVEFLDREIELLREEFPSLREDADDA